MSLHESLRQRWLDLAGPDAAPLGDDLIARWDEPHRKYHTLTHLAAVLDGVDVLERHADDPDAVRYAAWFHDAVYDSTGGGEFTNEELSARLAESELPEIGISARRTVEIARLVRLTTAHAAAPGDRNGAVLCDADLAVLGSDDETYAAYTRAIRAEYASVPDELFRPGRAAILRGLLDLPTLYRTEAAQERYDRRARANLAAEIAFLEE